MSGAWGGITTVLGTTAIGAIVIGSVLYARDIAAAAVRASRRIGVLPVPPPTPAGMPLERITRDLRRLRPQARLHRPGVPVARHRGIVAAYDDALVDACRTLDITTDLTELPDGVERESERLRVEAELEKSGIRLDDTP